MLEFKLLSGIQVRAFPIRLPKPSVGALSVLVASEKLPTCFYVLKDASRHGLS